MRNMGIIPLYIDCIGIDTFLNSMNRVQCSPPYISYT